MRENVPVEDLPKLLADEKVIIWLDIVIKNAEDLRQAEDIYTNIFDFHHLTIEDCRETKNQPKVEEFPEYLFFIVQGLKAQPDTSKFITKELDGYLGKNFVITNHHQEFRSINSVKRQIRTNPRTFQKGAAYLLHQIFDRLVEMYIPVVEDFDGAINEIEDRVYKMDMGSNAILEEIMDVRRSVARLKRISTRQLDVLYRISHGEFPQIPENILPFYRDVHDHLLRIYDMAESYRDLVSGLFEIHFSVTANKTNEVMKTLAIFSAILLPLSVITGVYGMNFENMPLLHTPDGYLIAFGFMFLIFGGLLIYFWRRGWFG